MRKHLAGWFALLVCASPVFGQTAPLKIMVSVGDVTAYMSSSEVSSLELSAAEQIKASSNEPVAAPWTFYTSPIYNDSQTEVRQRVVENMVKVGASHAMLIAVYGDIPVCRSILFVNTCAAVVRATLSLVDSEGKLIKRFDEQGEGAGTSASDAIREGGRAAIRKVIDAAIANLALR